MQQERIVVAAEGDDAVARRAARRLWDEGHEVVFVGGDQSPEQVVRTAVAEDASRIVVDASDAVRDRIALLCAEVGADDVAVEATGPGSAT